MKRIQLRLAILLHELADLPLYGFVLLTSELTFSMQAARAYLARRLESLRCLRDDP